MEGLIELGWFGNLDDGGDMKETKLPWMIRKNIDKTPYRSCDGNLIIIDQRGFFISTVHADADEHEEVLASEQVANAELIVRAVNTFNQTREALRWIVHLHCGVSKFGGEQPITPQEWEEAIESGRKAIASMEAP